MKRNVTKTRGAKSPSQRLAEVHVLNREQLANHVGHMIAVDKESIYGDPQQQFAFAQALKAMICADKFGHAIVEREALDMICTKISRLCHGQSIQDTWLDIAGYALIAAEGAHRPLTTESE